MKKAAGAEQSFDVARKVALADYTSFGIGGAVDFFLKPVNAAGVKSAIAFCREREMPFFVLGGGTNVLASDKPETSAVLHTGLLGGCEIKGTLLRCGAGEPLFRVVRQAAEAGLAGLENLVGIPGTVGGACWMNAGGRYGDIGDVIESVETVTFTGKSGRVSRDRMNFSYRRGPFRRRVITSVSLRLRRGGPEEIFARMRRILAEKRSSQPLGSRSAGCVFKNPRGQSAGKLIDRAGMKGHSCGGAEVSRTHANFIVNRGNARADDVVELIERIRRRVQKSARRKLAREIIFLK